MGVGLTLDRHEQELLAGLLWDRISDVECRVSKLKLSFYFHVPSESFTPLSLYRGKPTR